MRTSNTPSTKKNRWEDLDDDQYDKITYTPSWNYGWHKRPTQTLHKTKAELEEEQSTTMAGRQKKKEMRQKLAQNSSSHRKSHRPKLTNPKEEEKLPTPDQDMVQGSPNITEDDEEDSSSLLDKPTGVSITIKTNRDHPRLNALTQCGYFQKEREDRRKERVINWKEYI